MSAPRFHVLAGDGAARLSKFGVWRVDEVYYRWDMVVVVLILFGPLDFFTTGKRY